LRRAGFTKRDYILDGVAGQACLREFFCAGSPGCLQVVVEVFEEGFEADGDWLSSAESRAISTEAVRCTVP
jgi:hypothetical protein